MTEIRVEMSFIDVMGKRHNMTIVFRGHDIADCYEQALSFCTEREEFNDWMLLTPLKVEILKGG